MVTSVTQSCPLKLNHSSQDPNVAPHPSVYIWNVSLYKEPLENLPSIWIPTSILTHMTARRHSAPQPSVRKVSKSPPSQNKQSILHTKHTAHIKHDQWKQSYQVRTIRASLDYKSMYALYQSCISNTSSGSISSQISSLAAWDSMWAP